MNRTRDLCICSQKLWPLDHRGGLVARAGGINCFIMIYCGVSFICLWLLGTLARELIYSLCSSYVNTLLRAPHGGKFALNILIYYTCTGCIIVIVCILVFLCSTPSTVLPLFPRTKSGAVSVGYRGCKASVIELCARNLPCGGFAVLSPFQVRGFL